MKRLKWFIAALVISAIPVCSHAAGQKSDMTPVKCVPVGKLIPLPARLIPASMFDIVADESKKQGVPVWIAYRMFEVESVWDPLAVNVNRDEAGRVISVDCGIGQLNSTYLDDFSIRFNDGIPINPFDPEINIRVSIRLLGSLYKATGDWPSAVASYNCGLARFRSGNLPEKTRRHVARVFGNRDKINT